MATKDIFTLADAVKMTGPAAFGTMVKPAGSTCNLDCTYCYYLDKALQYGGRQAVMSDELLEEYIRQYIEANQTDEVSFCWHGGEPLLLGLDYFRRAVALQKQYAAGKTVHNSIQTNGTLVNAEWCRFFAGEGFLVGVSLDGPKDIHDTFRRTRAGGATYDRVMDAVKLFKQYKVEFNTLSVVNSRCEGRGAEVYRFLRDVVKSRYMQFLPAVEHVIDVPSYHRPLIVDPSREGARLAPWSVSSAGYGRFLCDVFDEWVRHDVGTVFVQMFDATLAGWCGVPPGVCSMVETCGENLLVEHNGDVYPCDHFVYPRWLLGNIRQTPLSELFELQRRRDFGLAKRNTLPGECLGCQWYHACHGECPKHRFDAGSDGSPKNYLCEGLKAYFSHVAPYMDYMKELLEHHQPPAWVMRWRGGA